MKIKSLLIGSAALMTVSTGSYAADAVVMAEPEPVEYVRVCDVYGAGFFYIPGTETCLKIGGYVRDDVSFLPNFSGYRNRARFTPTFDARSETEWGTLRAYAEVEISADTFTGTSLTVMAPGAVPVVGLAPGVAPLIPATNIGTSQWFNIAHAFIEVQGASGTFRIGRTHTPFARFLGYGPTGFTNDGAYGFNNQSEISYTLNGGNGFSAIIALVDNPNGGGWQTNVEGGINFAQGWGSIGAIIGYDAVNSQWGGKAVARFKGGNGFSAGLHVFYSSFTAGVANTYRVSGLQQNWSIMGNVSFQASPKVNFNVYAQWFDSPAAGGDWAVAASVGWTPVTNLLIRPEVRYQTTAGGTWDGVVRFQRSF